MRIDLTCCKYMPMLFRGGIALLLTLVCSTFALSDDTSLVFDSLRCRFTLPGSGWQWVDPASIADAVCVARGPDGLTFILSVKSVPREMAISERFVTNVDKSAYAPAHLKKRGGRIMTFKGLPCYESLALVNEGTTSATRYVISDGFAYLLQLHGGPEQVESRPDFEVIMGSFEILPSLAATPSIPTRSTLNGENSIFFLLGKITAFCLTMAAIVAVIRWSFRGRTELP